VRFDVLLDRHISYFTVIALFFVTTSFERLFAAVGLFSSSFVGKKMNKKFLS
jgi:hypothetical protein